MCDVDMQKDDIR